MRVVLLFVLSALLLLGETFKLYLKDGGYHLVREYQVLTDRIRYFSTERGEWEEIPKELVDLDKTERERKGREEEMARQARAEDEEEKAEREQRREIESIPMETGAYYRGDTEKVKALALADYQVLTDKKRKVLQTLSPVPLIPGKASVVIKGSHSNFIVNEPRPSFYVRLAKEEPFGIVSVTPKKDSRIVENISIVPVAKQAIEDRKQQEAFQQQLRSGLYRIWPEKPLAPGEYALVEYADTGDTNDIQLLIWDFAYQPAH